ERYKKSDSVVNTPAYARNYQPRRQRTAAIIRNRHGSIIYDTEVDKDMWVRHHNQLRREQAGPTINKRYLSLYSLFDTFNLIPVLLPRIRLKIRMKPSRLQTDLSSKTYR
ncbi:unnamed protein product, partial [Hymenolepis diminuta]